MHYFQFNIGEYASHTRHLSPIEDITYRRLLDLAYTTELPLIKDIHQLSRLTNLREYEKEISDILTEFFFEVDDGWVNNRVIKEIERTGRKSESARNSAALRWQAERMRLQCERNANAYDTDANATKNDATNNPLPKTNNPKPKKPDALTRFPEFWAAYPRRDDRAKAEKAWITHGCDAIADAVVNGAVRYGCEKVGSEKKYIALPTSWLNGKRWMDEGNNSINDEFGGAV
jgi:uncharacterized protein YdaU (DUF1376 family)